MANGSAAKDVSKDVSTAPLPPFVFQCRACRQVVGDSTNLDCSVRSLACVALTGERLREQLSIDVRTNDFASS